jgi:hypothetical protein
LFPHYVAASLGQVLTADMRCSLVGDRDLFAKRRAGTQVSVSSYFFSPWRVDLLPGLVVTLLAGLL